MDFFERWFGLSPDNGDGTSEILWVVALLAIATVWLFRRRIGSALRKRSRS